jgi:hypothetical protein
LNGYGCGENSAFSCEISASGKCARLRGAAGGAEGAAFARSAAGGGSAGLQNDFSSKDAAAEKDEQKRAHKSLV